MWIVLSYLEKCITRTTLWEKMTLQHLVRNVYRYDINNFIKATKKDISRIYIGQYGNVFDHLENN